MASADSEEQVFNGIAASPGIAHGQVFLLRQKELTIRKYKISEDEFRAEEMRFEAALMETRRQIQSIRDQVKGTLGEDEARIFDAHLLVLEDRALIEESIREMETSFENIEAALWEVGQRYIQAFDQMNDEYLRERASDIRDVFRRLISNLMGQQMEKLSDLVDGHVLVARDIAPSDSASVDSSNLQGIVTDAGSKTSHAVIVARSLRIPAVVGLGDFTEKVNHEDVVLVDGYEGRVILNPSEDTLFKYGKLKIERKGLEDKMIKLAQKASTTKDGHKIQLMANIEKPEEAKRALEMGADGIGLFRTEYLFMNAHMAPSEEQQFQAYKTVAETMGDMPVIIRTLDLGGDKIMQSGEFAHGHESNPFLGYRAIRFCLDHVDLFKSQLRAILRASIFGNVRLMYPMISGQPELQQANQILEDCKHELAEEGVKFNSDIKAGSMIEIPSAAIASDLLVNDTDFFSIGTNDLIQYTIAVDRLNDRVAHLYEPTHPAILRVIETVIRNAKEGNIGVGLCGEVAGDPVMVPLLIGFGVDSLSMSAGLLPNVKYVVQHMTLDEAEELAKMALAEPDSTKILESLLDFYTTRMAELY
ncbi:MAG: phosphoenolpyruvate--protein phosphotransferase [Verrucomicrobiota bacterium]